MRPAHELPAGVTEILRCPACRGNLAHEVFSMRCEACRCSFPVVDGIPILIHDARSVFAVDDFVNQRNTTFVLNPRRRARLLGAITPNISANFVARSNYARFAELLAENPAPTVLVLGGSIVGSGFEILAATPNVRLIESDVSLGPRTMLICDGHDIPFADASLNGVVVQAVLEHVVDPHRVVAEIHRVLKPGGLVYAETPFMQQMHGGRYDFERFSYWGHRRLFNHFDEVESGVATGPGMALAWAWTYFLRSFAPTRQVRHILHWLGAMTSWWLKYLDRYLVRQPEAIQAASGYYFLGRRAEQVLSDRDLVSGYAEAMRR